MKPCTFFACDLKARKIAQVSNVFIGRGGDRGGRDGGRGRFGDREGGSRFGGRGGGRRGGGFGDGGRGGGFGSDSGGFSSGGGFSNDAVSSFQSNGFSPCFESAPAHSNDFGSSGPGAPAVEQKVDTVEHSITSSAAPTTVETTVGEIKVSIRLNPGAPTIIKKSERLPTQPEESKAVESSSEPELSRPAISSVKYVRFQPLKIPDDNLADVYLSVAVSPDE
uniref:Uncharacterized protein n=1 Tax=Romanomermis culicivorax TaxID=13658 RepID=A0A915HHG6_ROMCU